ncbi:MAG TPA: sodium:solute symporter [Candidatus Acidoferrales bacterium]|nr:sodium:solute symporter [Candidatus Acidoferrales bacterium]
MGFGLLDLAIVIAYLVGVTALGAYFRRRQRTIHDYFLGGRDTHWGAICLSIVATETSTLTIIGTPALAYAGNLAFLQLVLGYIVARFVISFLLLPQYFSGQLYTAYQYIEQRFGLLTRRLAASLFLITRALADAVRLWAIAIVVQLLLPRVFELVTGETLRVAELTAVIVVMALTLVYTYLGGMKAVIWTDVVQFGIYVGGGAIALGSLFAQIPGGWATVAAEAGHKFAMFDFSLNWQTSYTFWAGLLGGTFLTLASHGTDQLMVQRLLAARNLRESRRALIASGFIVFAQFLLFLVIGILLYVFYHHVPPSQSFANPDRIFPIYMVSHLPAGISGLMVAGVLAAAMSTSSATLNSLAASTVVDFYRPLAGSSQDPGELLRRSRWVTVVWGGLLIGLTMLARQWGPVLEAGLTIASITYGALLGLFLLGRLAPRATPAGAAAGMLVGLAAILYVKFFTSLAWTWYVLVGTLITFVVGLLLSEVLPRRAGSSR